MLLVASAHAQNGIAPLPPADSSLQRITPLDEDPTGETMLTTHAMPAREPAKAKPNPTPAPVPVPAFATAPLAAQPPLPMKSLAGAKSPFAHAEMPKGPAVPSGPHDVVASPVGQVDAVEVSEPAPPTPVAPGANPVAEDPAAPTEFSSPMFSEEADSGEPRKIVVRVLNKVTGQASLYKAHPGDIIKFGRLEIVAEMCRVSVPTSQPDSAGLLDIREHVPGVETVKPLFHGWMYASSPSITALEHPIYDVTVVDCEIGDKLKEEPKKPEKTKKK